MNFEFDAISSVDGDWHVDIFGYEMHMNFCCEAFGNSVGYCAPHTMVAMS